MIGALGLFTLVLWCSYVTSVGEKSSEELEFNVKTGDTALIPTAKNRITVSAQMSWGTYCTSVECKTITCNSILSLDSGQVASAFLANAFKAQCSTEQTVSALMFIESSFPGNQLTESWLTSIIGIKGIKFENCDLKAIKEKAFSSFIFNSTESLSLINTKIRILNKYVFEELDSLHNLVIQNNLLLEVEYNLLNNAAETLETIELDKSIENMQVLFNITRGKQLPKVQLLSLQGNNIPYLSNEILQAFPNVISLYMDSSRIQSIHENTFESCRQIKQIFINNNRLTTLSESTFKSLLYYSPQLKIAMIENPWNCDCDLKWIQDVLLESPQMMTKIPICQTPIKNTNESFLTAEFCEYQLSSTLDTSTKLQSTTIMPISYSTESSIKILCQNSLSLLRNSRRKLFSISDYEFPSKQSDFFLQQLKNGSIIVNLSNNNSQAILWFKNFNNNIGDINCLKNIREKIILNDLQDDSLYTICLLDKSILEVSPFNCLAFKTLPVKNARIWLSNGDKTFVLSVYSVIAFLFCILGGGSCFYIVKKHPTLLKGSKRVILVKRGQVNALVLPKGIDDDFFERVKKEKTETLEDLKIPRVDYLTPIIKRNHCSNIYDSIDNKSVKNLKSNSRESVGEENVPPPLPPHPFHGVIPSVSLLMDLEHKVPSETNEIQDDTEIYSCIQPK